MEARMERIVNRLPRFYRAWDDRSTVSQVLNAFSSALNEHEKRLYFVMKSHWVDTAYGMNLDFLGSIFSLKRKMQEEDEKYRRRIKSAIETFKGGGTKEAILTHLRSYFDLKDEEVEVLENPEEEMSYPVGEDVWDATNNGTEQIIRSKSVQDEDVQEIVVQMTGSTADLKGVRGPTITDRTRGVSIKYDGTMIPGDTLRIRKDSADINGKEIKEKIEMPKVPFKIPRSKCEWVYTESTSPILGFYGDKDHTRALFSDREHINHLFFTSVPTARIKIKWKGRVVAKIRVTVAKHALDRTNSTKADLEDLVNAIKAAGVIADVRVA